MGGFDIDSDGQLVVEQTQFYQDVYAFQDLVRYDPASRRTTLLTRRERARDPALSPDGEQVAYSKNGASQSELWVMACRAPDRRRMHPRVDHQHRAIVQTRRRV